MIHAAASATVVPGEGIFGWMSVEELSWLYHIAQQTTSIIEIGSWFGRSTTALCAGCRGIVYAVDHFLGSPEIKKDLDRFAQDGIYPYEEFLRNMQFYANMRPFPMSSFMASTSKLIPQEVDMVFIDGAHDHDSVVADLNLWERRARILVAGHDLPLTSVRTALKDYFHDRLSKLKAGPGMLWYVPRGEGINFKE